MADVLIAASLLSFPLITEATNSASSLLVFPLITEATILLMQSVGFDFFLAGEPNESGEAVEVEAFKVGTVAMIDGIFRLSSCFLDRICNNRF